MGNELMEDLAAAWPEDDDLTLSGANDDAETIGTIEPSAGDNEYEDSGSLEEAAPVGADEPGSADDIPGRDEAPGEGAEPDQEDVGSPVSWNASAREQWKGIPKEAQSYILQREQQMQDGMQKNAEMAKRAGQMDQVLAPFQQYFAMNGNAPGQSVKTLLETASILQMGSPNQQAQMVANLIGQFGVDIPSLDAILTGKQPNPEAAPQQNHAVQQQIQQAVAPYQQHMQQLEQQKRQEQQQTHDTAASEVTTFAQDVKNEFYNDVRGDMADILDMAANRGLNLTMKEAYDRACTLNPEINKIIQSRATQKQMQKRRLASSSVQGGMGGPGDNSPAGGMRNTIEDAWDNAGRM